MAVWRVMIVGIGLLLLAACGSRAPEESIVSVTRTLMPPTATPTLAPAETSPTPTDLPAASALETLPTTSNESLIPAAAQAMIDLTMADLMVQPGIDPAAIRLLSLDEFVWRDESWGCTSRPDDENTPLTPGPGYRIVFGVGRHTYVYHTDRRASYFACEDRAWLALEGEPVPLDPIELAMVELVARDAAKYVETPESDLTLVSLLAVEWPDSSVGCPRAGADYAETPTPGYRMVFRAGEETRLYHTSIRHFVRCTSAEEILPNLLRQALPTPTPGTTGS